MAFIDQDKLVARGHLVVEMLQLQQMAHDTSRDYGQDLLEPVLFRIIRSRNLFKERIYC